MANDSKSRSEANAQNSEIKPETHPSGARIEKMMSGSTTETVEHERTRKREADERNARDHVVNTETGNEMGEGGEVLRPSERYTPPEDPAEGSREQESKSPHRGSPETRDR